MQLLSYAETLASLQDGEVDLTLVLPNPFTQAHTTTRFWDSFDLGPAHCWH